jgi:hypothetical protein
VEAGLPGFDRAHEDRVHLLRAVGESEIGQGERFAHELMHVRRCRKTVPSHNRSPFGRVLVVRLIAQIWPENGASAAEQDPTAIQADILYDTIEELSPQNETQRSHKAQVQKMTIDLAQTRWLLFEQGVARSRCRF